jgi:hypothetical protein
MIWWVISIITYFILFYSILKFMLKTKTQQKIYRLTPVQDINQFKTNTRKVQSKCLNNTNKNIKSQCNNEITLW